MDRLFYNETFNSFRKFEVAELTKRMKSSTGFAAARALRKAERERDHGPLYVACDPATNLGDVQLARRFSGQ